jgi:cytochrome c oxidase cbb3-type subunit 3
VPAIRCFLAAVLAGAALHAWAAEDAVKGRAVFRAHCAQCHGENADGRGPLASRFDPPPADITVSRRTDDYMLQIVTLGGEALGRSAVMPQWGLELSGDEILDVVTYLREVVRDAARARAQAARGAS